MATNQAIEKVFNNDYIMTDILRRLDLKQQCEVRKICQRLKFLITTCVWRKDLKIMQLHRKHLGTLGDDDFFQLLQLNADNIRKLVVEEIHGYSFPKYFAVCYENLLELQITNYRPPHFEEFSIFANCPNLEIFYYYSNDRLNESVKPKLYSFVNWQKLKNLKVLILKNFFGSILYEDICELASKVPLKHLELCFLHIASSKFESAVTLSNMKIVRLVYFRNKNFQHKFAKIIERCPNIEEIKVHPSEGYQDIDFTKFPFLKSLSLMDFDLSAALAVLQKNNNIKSLSAYYVSREGSVNKTEIRGLCSSVEIISLSSGEGISCGFTPWLCFFSSYFENLLELELSGEDVNDYVLRLVSLNCPQLKKLSLENVYVSGKYINNLSNLRKLIINQRKATIPWYNLFVILRDLIFLQHLTLTSRTIRNNFSIPRSKHMGNALLTLDISRVNDNFWEELVLNCEQSFQNMQTFKGFNKGTYKRLYKLFKNLTSISTHIWTNLDMKVMPANLLSLTSVSYTHWPHIIEILRASRLEKLQIKCFSESGHYVDSDDSVHDEVLLEHDMNDINIFKDIRKVLLLHEFFLLHIDFWMLCIEKCPKFQLSIVCDEEYPTKILEPLLKDSMIRKCLTGIHSDSQLSHIKTLIGVDTNGAPKIPLYLLNEESPLWDQDSFQYAEAILILVK